MNRFLFYVLRLVVSLLGASLALAAAWLLGYDFDERGGMAFIAAVWFLAIFGLAWTLPEWQKLRRKM